MNIGQLQVVDLSWLIQNDSVVGALLTGMFSIQADPRLIEVIAWAAYLIPVMVIYCWPSKHSFTYERRQLTRRICAGACIVVAIGMALLCPHGNTDVAGATHPVQGNSQTTEVTLLSAGSDAAQITYEDENGIETVDLSKVSEGELDGVPLTQWEGSKDIEPDASLPSTVTLNELRSLNNGRVPSGLNTERNPGPFSVKWSETATYSARTAGASSLLRASCDTKLIATLTGGGISGTKTVSVSGAVSGSWAIADDEVSASESAVQQAQLAAEEAKLWWLWCPVALVCVAAGVLAYGEWDRRSYLKKQSEKEAAV